MANESSNPFLDIPDDNPFLSVDTGGVPPAAEPAKMAAPPSAPQSMEQEGYTKHYYEGGKQAMTEGLDRLAQELGIGKSPVDMTEEEMTRAYIPSAAKTRAAAQALGGGITALTAAPAGMLTRAIAPPLRAVEEFIGLKGAPIASAAEKYMPDIAAIFGPPLLSRVGKSASLAGELATPEALTPGVGDFKPNKLDKLYQIEPSAPKPTVEAPLDLQPAYAKLFEQRVGRAPKPDELAELAQKTSPAEVSAYIRSVQPKAGYGYMPAPGEADYLSAAKDEPWFPEHTGPGPAATLSQQRRLQELADVKAAVAKERMDRLFPEPQQPTVVPPAATKTPDARTFGAQGEGPTLNAEYTLWPKSDVTEMHSGVKPAFPDLQDTNFNFSKVRAAIRSLPGVERLLEATEPTMAYIRGPQRSAEYLGSTRSVRGQQAEINERVRDLSIGLDKAIGETLKDNRWANAFSKADARVRVGLALKGDYSQLPKGSPIEQVTRQVRDTLNLLGKEKRARGLISEEAGLNANYVRRLYARDVMGGDEWARIIPADVRAKGVDYILRNDKIKVGDFWRAPTSQEAQAIADSLIRTGNSGVMGQRLRSPYKISSSQLKKRQDIPPEIRSLMGEIDDGTYLAARTIHDGANLVVMHDFFKGFAKGSETIKGVSTPWMSETPRMGYRPVKMNDYTRQAMGKKPGEPVYVLEKYAHDFDSAFGAGSEGSLQAVFDKVYNPLYNTFKAAKTIYNPATHGRNVLGNVIFASGARNSPLNPANLGYYRDALKEILGVGAGAERKLYHEALRSGAVGGELPAAELKQISDSFYAAKGNWLDFFKRIASPLNNPLARGLGKAYTAEDQIFKLASFIKQRRLGMTPEQASLHTNKFFPRYDELSPLVQNLRQGVGSAVGSPFVSFAAEALRIGKNMLRETPLQLAAWTLGIPGLSYAFRTMYEGQTGRNTAAEIRKIPPELRSPLGTFFLPMPDARGNLQFVDTTYWHPLGQFLKGIMSGDQAPNIASLPFVSDFVGGNPILNLVTEIMTNTQLSQFHRGEMVKRPSEGNEAYWKHGVKALAPPLLPGGTSARQIGAAATGRPGRFGQRQSLGQSLIGELTPFRVQSVDPQMAAFTQSLQRSETRRIDEDLRRVQNEFKKGKISAGEFRNAVKNIYSSQQSLTKQYQGR